MVYEKLSETDKELDAKATRLAAETVKRFKEQIKELENIIVLQTSLLDWIEAVCQGDKINDFALSFPIVRDVADIAHQLKHYSELDHELGG